MVNESLHWLGRRHAASGQKTFHFPSGLAGRRDQAPGAPATLPGNAADLMTGNRAGLTVFSHPASHSEGQNFRPSTGQVST
jgi:hypothetical protein